MKNHLLSAKISALLILSIIIPAFAHAQWSAPVNITPNAIHAGLNESMGSCIGTSGDSIHVVWCDTRAANRNVIYYRHSLDTGLTWSNPITLSDTTSNCLNPAIAVCGKNIHVVWRFLDPANNAHRISYYRHSLDGGNTWGPAIWIDSTSDWPAVSVSGSNVYIANDRHITAANSEIFFLRSTNNGTTWSAEQRLTFANLRSEDEAIHAEKNHVYMSWNDNRSGQFQILYKASNDYGVTWGPDVVVVPQYDYSTMVWSDGANVNVVSGGNPVSNHYQIILCSSSDSGATWNANMNLTNDTAHTYFYPDMVRDGSDLHVVCGGNNGARYFHSSDGGTTWDAAFTFVGGSTFIAYSGCALHIIYIDATHHIFYMRNPTGNGGPHCPNIAMGISTPEKINELNLFPNPTNNSFTIQSSKELGMITIYNSLGEIIYNEKSNATSQQIDLSNFSSGIYFVATQGKYLRLVKE